jgi:branched-chain amino acid transport system permease protein
MRTLAPGFLAAVLASAGVAFIDPYARFLLAQLSVLVIAVLSLNLLGNVAGMLSLASAAFMGLGGYVALIFLTIVGIPLILAVPLTIAAGWLVGWLIGLIAIRLSGISLAIATLGFVQVFQVFAKQGGALSGDGYGLVMPPIDIPLLGPLTTDVVSIACVFIAIVALVLATTLIRSRIGRVWFAIKEHPIAAQMQGVNLTATRARAFATAGAIASLAGILQAILLGITNPNLYTIDVSISHLTMMVVGGASGGAAGAVLGPAILFLVPEYFDLGAYREVLFGGALLSTLALAPRGLSGIWDYAARRFPRAK